MEGSNFTLYIETLIQEISSTDENFKLCIEYVQNIVHSQNDSTMLRHIASLCQENANELFENNILIKNYLDSLGNVNTLSTWSSNFMRPHIKLIFANTIKQIYDECKRV